LGNEVCDAGTIVGCLSDCSGSSSGWNCSIGGSLVPSICTPICGDGQVVGIEKCDAGKGPGCLSDCSAN